MQTSINVLYVAIYIYIKLFMSYTNVFINHMDYPAILTCLSVTSYYNSEKSGFHHQPPIYLILQFQYTYIVTSELVTHLPVGNNFDNYSIVLT